MALTLFNCADNDSIENDVITQDSLIGEWHLYKTLNYNDITEAWDLADYNESVFLTKQIYNEDGTMVAQVFVNDVLDVENIWSWERDLEYDLSLTRGAITYKMYANTFCSENILQIQFSPTLIEYFKKPGYNPSQCDEVVYENE